MVDLRRRFFVFGAAAVLAVPPTRKFFIFPRQSVPAIIHPGEFYVPSLPSALAELQLDQMKKLAAMMDRQVVSELLGERYVVLGSRQYEQITGEPPIEDDPPLRPT